MTPKKKYLLTRYIILAIALAVGIVFAILIPVLSVISFIFIVIAILVVLLELYGIYDSRRRFCPECGAQYSYDDIYWIETSEDTTSNNNGDVTKKAFVEITAICDNCGKERTFGDNFIIAQINGETGKVRHYNLEQLIRSKYGRKKR